MVCLLCLRDLYFLDYPSAEMTRKKPLSHLCPCGSDRPFDDCCGPIIAGQRPAPSAEALMRSRYSAFALGDDAWLLASWHPSTKPDALASEDQAPLKWIGLSVKRHEQTGADTAIVEFVARYRANGRAGRLHETSNFRCENGEWLYVDGELHSADR